MEGKQKIICEEHHVRTNHDDQSTTSGEGMNFAHEMKQNRLPAPMNSSGQFLY